MIDNFNYDQNFIKNKLKCWKRCKCLKSALFQDFLYKMPMLRRFYIKMVNYPIATLSRCKAFLKVKTYVQITRPVKKLLPLDFFWIETQDRRHLKLLVNVTEMFHLDFLVSTFKIRLRLFFINATFRWEFD